MEPVQKTSDHGVRRDLVIAGRIKGAAGIDVDLTVAIETVVADHEISEILAMYGTSVHLDDNGHFVDRYDLPDDVRDHLHGWVMCTVVVQPRVAGAPPYVKAVRWQRPASNDLIAGLSALLATVSLEVDGAPADGPHAAGGAPIRRLA
jgi:hypothetical protein